MLLNILQQYNGRLDMVLTPSLLGIWGKNHFQIRSEFLRPASAVGERALGRGAGGWGHRPPLLYKPPSRAWDPVGAAPVFIRSS